MILLRVTAALALVIAPVLARAFHDGGVGACEGCHAMHTKPTGDAVSASLLLGSDASSTCLVCHGGSTPGGYQVLSSLVSAVMPPANFTPGGDFAWTRRSYSWIGPKGTPATSPGASHGHNVTALDALLEPDYFRPTAPGGSYPSDRLSCISCHDPHGRYRLDVTAAVRTDGAPTASSGSYGGVKVAVPTPAGAVGVYRLLGGVGYAPKAAGAVVPFSASPPVALAPQTYNQSERTAEVRVAYGSGMSEWCRNCHGNLHTTTATNTTTTFNHPAGSDARLNSGAALGTYNTYIRSGVFTGTQAMALLHALAQFVCHGPLPSASQPNPASSAVK